MKYKLLIFDFDGTLADSFPWYKSIINIVADKYKLKKITESEWELLRSYEATKIYEYLRVPTLKIPVITKHVQMLMTEDIQKISLFEGISNLLKQSFDNGIVLAIVTSNSLKNVLKVLGKKNAVLIKYFECGTPVFGKQKKIEKILLKSRISRKDAIYIGDEIRDVEAAKKTNIAFGGVSWGYNTIDSLMFHSPEEIFNSVNDIIQKLIYINEVD